MSSGTFWTDLLGLAADLFGRGGSSAVRSKSTADAALQSQ